MFFDSVNEAPPDPIFGLLSAFQADRRKEKVSLMVGIYKDDQLRAELFSSARLAKVRILDEDVWADYLPIDGYGEMVERLGPWVFGPGWGGARERIYGAHTTGGTGALRVASEFFAQELSKHFAITNHTWPNHRSIIEKVSGRVELMPYYSREKRGFDLEASLAFLKRLPEKSIVLLHACCHNPTGCDPTAEEWLALSRAIKERHLFPFFDFAYQGLGEGLEPDRFAVELFLKEGHEMAVAYSCSKNFSMYCQRVGALYIVSEKAAAKPKIASQIKRIIRTLYSNPPAHGAGIVTEILESQELTELWKKDLASVRHRLNFTREALVQRLNRQAKPRSFDHLRKHKGMFSFIDLDKPAVQKLLDRYAIYMTDNGRISIAGLTTKNIDYVVQSLCAVLT